MSNIPKAEVLSTTQTPLHGSWVLQTQLVREETYTFYPNDGTPEVHIRSGGLVRMLHDKALNKVIELTFPEETLEQIVERNGVCIERADALTDELASVPVVVGLWHDGSGILIDGAHRRYYWAKRGIHTIRGWAVPEGLWRAYVFDPSEIVGAVIDRGVK